MASISISLHVNGQPPQYVGQPAMHHHVPYPHEMPHPYPPSYGFPQGQQFFPPYPVSQQFVPSVPMYEQGAPMPPHPQPPAFYMPHPAMPACPTPGPCVEPPIEPQCVVDSNTPDDVAPEMAPPPEPVDPTVEGGDDDADTQSQPDVFIEVDEMDAPQADASELDERDQQLIETKPMVLYHQTHLERAEKILQNGFEAGECGLAGGGIYFAASPEATCRKAKRRGVILECLVLVGRRFEGSKEVHANQEYTFDDLAKRGFDSVHVTGMATGDEVIVYNPDQVAVVTVHSDSTRQYVSDLDPCRLLRKSSRWRVTVFDVPLNVQSQQQLLDQGPTVLYYQTDPEETKTIISEGFREAHEPISLRRTPIPDSADTILECTVLLGDRRYYNCTPETVSVPSREQVVLIRVDGVPHKGEFKPQTDLAEEFFESGRWDAHNLGVPFTSRTSSAAVELPVLTSSAFKLNPKSLIGNGGYGTVHKEVLGDKTVAVKWIHDRASFQKEKKILSKLLEDDGSKRHIPKVHGFITDCESGGGVVMKYFEKNLLKHVEGMEGIPRKEYLVEAKGLMVQVAEAVLAVHRLDIIHRDLKPDNILVEVGPKGLKLVLCDFGISKHEETAQLTSGAKGTGYYIAPEMTEKNPECTKATDAYALGWVFYFIATGEQVTRELRETEVCEPADDKALRDIIRGLTHKDPKKRSSVTSLTLNRCQLTGCFGAP